LRGAGAEPTETPMAVSFQELVIAFETVSWGEMGEMRAYLCRQSGKIHVQSDNDPELEELPDDLDNGEKYIQIPDKRELDLGKPLVMAFASEFLPDDFDKVRQMFSRRGAYARFNDLLDYRNMRQKWFDYRDEAEAEALRAWCKENSVELAD
jgi:hypothetical protein